MIHLASIFLDGEQGPILNELDLSVKIGETVGLIGLSGSGKSSALKVASGALHPNRGRIRIEMVDVTRHPQQLSAATALSTPDLVGPYDLSVGGWMSYWSSVRGGIEDHVERETQALEAFGLMEHRLVPVSQLSHSQRRCLDLARVWAIDPAIYLLDQPDAFLDGASFQLLRRALKKLRERGKTVILATNSPNFPFKICHRVMYMKNGYIWSGDHRTPEDEDFQSFIYQAQGWK